MSNKLTLRQRIQRLELLLESKADQERLLNFLGDAYYDKYLSIKTKIKDPEYKDIYKLMKKDVADVYDYIDSFQSNTSKLKDTKDNGAKLLYNKNGWKVYKITTYKAAQIYGRNTKWCITGNYEGHEERGEEYFYSYLEDYDLDGGYYFYIKSNNEKYCVLQNTAGDIESVWDIQDNQISQDALPGDFPTVKEVNIDISKIKLAAMLRSGNKQLIKHAVFDLGANPNAKWHGNMSFFGEMLYDYVLDAGNVTTQSLQALVDYGDIDINQPQFRSGNYISYATNMGDIDEGSIKVAKFLIKNGINLNSKDSIESITRLPFSANTSEYTEQLLAILAKAGYNFNNKSAAGETLLQVAERSDHKSSRTIIDFINSLE